MKRVLEQRVKSEEMQAQVRCMHILFACACLRSRRCAPGCWLLPCDAVMMRITISGTCQGRTTEAGG